MIIDAHIHLWNPLHGRETGVDRQALRGGRARQGDSIYYAAPPAFEDSQSTYERALAHMDWLSIDRAVVLQEFMDGKQDEYEQRLCIAAGHANVFIDAGALTYRQRYPFPDARERLLRAFQGVPAEQIAWGTDYPSPAPGGGFELQAAARVHHYRVRLLDRRPERGDPGGDGAPRVRVGRLVLNRGRR